MLQPAKTDLMPASQAAGVSLWYIATRAGIAGGERSDNWILNYVRLLHANEDFPPPLPDFSLSRKTRRRGIHFKSRWNRLAVDAWFDGFLPPQLATVAADAAIARDALLLDARAESIAA